MSRMVGKPEVIWLRLDQPLSRRNSIIATCGGGAKMMAIRCSVHHFGVMAFAFTCRATATTRPSDLAF
jgi:hypothetical protein